MTVFTVWHAQTVTTRSQCALSKEYSLSLFHRVDNIDQEWSQKIHLENLFQQVRNSLAFMEGVIVTIHHAFIAYGGALVMASCANCEQTITDWTEELKCPWIFWMGTR